MPRMAETEARRPYPNVRRRACQESFREHKGDSAQTEDILELIFMDVSREFDEFQVNTHL